MAAPPTLWTDVSLTRPQSFCRHESNLHTLVERLGNPLEHGKRMPS